MAKSRSERAPQKPPAQCIFCGKHGNMSKQHVWPDWMGRDVELPTYRNEEADGGKVGNEQLIGRFDYSLDSTGQIEVNYSEEVKYKPAHIGTGKIRVVCKECNNGWMSQIEDDSKPIIKALMLNRDILLTTVEQSKIAAAFTLMTMVRDFTSEHQCVPDKDRVYLMTNKTAPL